MPKSVSCHFMCSNCGYQTDAKGTAEREGFVFAETVVCLDCKEIVDVVAGFDAEVLGFLSFGKTGMTPCPKCHSSNLTAWANDHPCPKCGHSLVVFDAAYT